MIIHCTRKVLGSAKISNVPESPITENADVKAMLHSWHANVLTVDRRKVLFFRNDATGISIIFHRPKPSDYKKLNDILTEGVRLLMIKIGFHEDIIEQYLADGEQCVITKASNRSQISRMNQVGHTIEWHSDDFESDYGLQMHMMIRLLKLLLGRDGGYKYPVERFLELMADVYGNGDIDSVYEQRSYILKIKLDLEKFDIYRVVEVPYNITFYDLHKVIMTVFDWSDHHLHDFNLLDGDLNRETPLLSLPIKLSIYDRKITPEMLMTDLGCPEINEDSIRLNEVFEENDWCLYTYDMGDNWEHIISVEERKRTGGSEHAVLLERKGECPPEDVGGESGFEEYMAIISNPSHPDYESALAWAEGQREKERTDEEINRQLKWIIL